MIPVIYHNDAAQVVWSRRERGEREREREKERLMLCHNTIHINGGGERNNSTIFGSSLDYR